MMSPEYIRRITEQSEKNAAKLHDKIISLIISRIVRRLERMDDYMFTATDYWQIRSLQESGYLLEDIQKEISSHLNIQYKEIKDCMEEAGVKALEYDHSVYEKAGLSPPPLRQSPNLIRIMQRDYEATNGEIRNLTRTTASAAQTRFVEECDFAYQKVMTGAESLSSAVKEAVNSIAANGVRIEYDSGRSDTIETAVSRAVRSGISHATGAIQMARMAEMDWDIILTSAHYGARTGDGGENPGNHYWWQGKFFSRNGTDKRFPDFYACTGYGTVTGLCGVNCRHSFGPGDGEHNPYEDIDSEENKRIEDINKHMRYMERNVRKRKRELIGIQTAIEASGDEKRKFELQQEYDRKAARLKKQNAAYIRYCKANEAKTLDERLQIANWNRQQAAKASAAARRYESG